MKDFSPAGTDKRAHPASAALIAIVALMAFSSFIASGSDTAPPTTTASLTGSQGLNGWNISSVSVTLQASDGDGSGVNYTRYNLAGTGWQNYTGKFTVSGDGARVLEFYSVDLANNTEVVESVTIKIDATNPVVSIEQASGGVYGSSDVRITWTSSDAVSGLDYFEVYSDGVLFDHLENSTRIEHVTNLVDGWHNVTLRAYDKAGNHADSVLSFRVWANQGNPNETTDYAVIAVAVIAAAVVASLLIIRWLRKKRPPQVAPFANS